MLQTGVQTRVYLVEGPAADITCPNPSYHHAADGDAARVTWEDRLR